MQAAIVIGISTLELFVGKELFDVEVSDVETSDGKELFDVEVSDVEASDVETLILIEGLFDGNDFFDEGNGSFSMRSV